jgi:hypothetical protein
MNERIRELARVAEQLADDELAHLERVHNRLYSFTEGREIYNKKFAELIVRECAEVITETRWHLPPTQQQIAIGIKEHFGVEE